LASARVGPVAIAVTLASNHVNPRGLKLAAALTIA
jgi:hypothetical protein